MKRFFLFAFDTYYPSGGMNDFISDHDTAEEAIAQLFDVEIRGIPTRSVPFNDAAAIGKLVRSGCTFDNAEVFDMQTGEKVWPTLAVLGTA